MKGYTIQNSIDLLEKNAGSGSGGASSAANVSFDNTGTGLSATNVQSAVEEVNTKATNAGTYSTTETVIGKWIDNSPIYRKVLEIPITQKSTDYDVSSLDVDSMINLYGVAGALHLPLNTVHEVAALPYTIGLNYGNDTIQIRFGEEEAIITPCYVVCEYTKNAVTNKTRKKK